MAIVAWLSILSMLSMLSNSLSEAAVLNFSGPESSNVEAIVEIVAAQLWRKTGTVGQGLRLSYLKV